MTLLVQKFKEGDIAHTSTHEICKHTKIISVFFLNTQKYKYIMYNHEVPGMKKPFKIVLICFLLLR